MRGREETGSWRIPMAVNIDTDACIACGACETACPLDAITVEDVAVVDEDVCCECGACVSACAVDALSL